MIALKIIISLFIAFAIINLYLQKKSKKISLSLFFTWLILWVLVEIIFLKPDLASYLALKLGIGRGSDLIVYLSIITIFYLMFKTLEKINIIENQITKIVKEIAIQNAKKGEGDE